MKKKFRQSCEAEKAVWYKNFELSRSAFPEMDEEEAKMKRGKNFISGFKVMKGIPSESLISVF